MNTSTRCIIILIALVVLSTVVLIPAQPPVVSAALEEEDNDDYVCHTLSNTRVLYLDDKDWPGNVGDAALGTITLNSRVCVEIESGRIVSMEPPQFQLERAGFGVSFDRWGRMPTISISSGGVYRVDYNVMAHFELTLVELLDWLGIIDLNNIRVQISASVYTNLTDDMVCLIMDEARLTEGPLAGTNRVYFANGWDYVCWPYVVG